VVLHGFNIEQSRILHVKQESPLMTILLILMLHYFNYVHYIIQFNKSN